MRVLIAYATTEGQTRKIARHAARTLVTLGHAVEVIEAKDAQPEDVDGADAVIFAGSLHMARFQPALAAFAARSAAGIRARPALFLAVSLAAAGDDPEDWKGLRRAVDLFLSDAGLGDVRVEHLFGAFRFSEYDFFRSWAMRWIAARKNLDVDAHRDLELTDWEALESALLDWSAQAAG